MANTHDFKCPNCGSPLSVTGEEVEVKCPYCGSTVVVPEELRRQNPTPSQFVMPTFEIDDRTSKKIVQAGEVAATVATGFAVSTIVFPILMTLCILGAVGVFVVVLLMGVNKTVQSVQQLGLAPTEIESVAYTATPEPTATPLATAIPFTKILLQDDFSKTSSGWDTLNNKDYIIQYTQGTYRIYIAKEDSGQYTWKDKVFTDVSVEADVLQKAGPDDGKAGVTCRITDKGDSSYSFEFSLDGSYGIYKFSGGSSEALAEGTLDPNTLNPQGTNRIRGDCVGDLLTLYLNDMPMLQVTDASYLDGAAGLIARTGPSSKAGIDMRFDNFKVRGP